MTAACAKPIPKEDNGTNFIKRIVAAPGDEMYVSEGHVIRNGKREKRLLHQTVRPGGRRECNFPRRSRFRPATGS